MKKIKIRSRNHCNDKNSETHLWFFPSVINVSFCSSNVCEEEKRRSVASSIQVTTVNYVYYKTRCGVFGWNRCTKSR